MEQIKEEKIKTREGSGYLKQLYSTARTTAGTTHTHLKNLTTFLVNFVPTEKVDASDLQVRVHFDDQEISALSHSVKEHGVLQPILVVQEGDRYKVIAGERRLRAAKLAGIDRIPARVLSTHDRATHEIALRENLDRVDLHPIEEGEGYRSLLESQVYSSHEAIAKGFGKPKSRVTECIGFTRLPEETKHRLMQAGIKNRALLRELLNTPTDQHPHLITQVIGKEEVFNGTALKAKKFLQKREKLTSQEAPRIFESNKKGLSVISFKWKEADGKERLKAYLEEIRQLVANVEERLGFASP